MRHIAGRPGRRWRGRIRHNRGVRGDFHLHIQNRNRSREIEMPGDAVGHVNRILVHPEVDTVRRLYVVANEAWVTVVFCRCKAILTVRQGASHYPLNKGRRKGLMLEDSWNVSRILSVDGAEIEILITEPQKHSPPPDRAGTLTKYGAKALIRGRRLKPGNLVERECDSRRRGSDRQL